MFGDIWNKIKEIVSRMLPKKSIEEVLHITPAVSDKMSDAIQLWSDMYEGKSPWLKEPTYEDPVRVVSLGLPALIASEKARLATLEMKTEISAPMQEVPINPNPEMMNGDTNTSLGIPTNSAPDSTKDVNSEVKPALTDNSSNVVEGGISSNSAYQVTKEQIPSGPTERADFLSSQYKKLIRQIRRQLEYGIAKGGLVIKPYIVIYDDTTTTDNIDKTQKIASNSDDNTKDNKDVSNTTESKNTQNNRLNYNPNLPKAEIEFDFIQADRFFPLAFDANGKVIEAAFVQTKVDKAVERVYLRLEYHKLEKRRVTVQNLAFESTDMGLANSSNIKSVTHLGKQISLKQVPEWANLQPITVIDDVDKLLFAYFKMPEANTVDPYSPLGVSGYSRVIQLIKDADMQYSRLLWEYEGGEMAIDVDRDALKFIENPDGHSGSVMPQKQQRLFRKVDLNTEDTYNVFAPNLRDASIVNGLNTIFMRIEDACGISRGTLSDVNPTTARTATELKVLKQRSYATNADIQAALQDALEDALYVMDVYSTLYEVTPAGEYEVSFEWDDSIIVDSESELSKRITLMQNGLASKLETRMWYFGETENQARAALQQIDQEATQAMVQNAQAEMMSAGTMGNKSDKEDEEDEEDDTKSPADTTSAKKSKGKQADNLENPDKSKTADNIKSEK